MSYRSRDKAIELIGYSLDEIAEMLLDKEAEALDLREQIDDLKKRVEYLEE